MEIITDVGKVRKALLLSPERGLSFIEQLQISTLNPCSKINTPHLTGVNQNEHKAILVKTACKMWNCEACAARNAKAWIAKVINGVNKLGGEWSFVTITSSRHSRGVRSIQNLRKGWKLIYNRIVYYVGGKTAENLYYVKVWEQHHDGSFHLHVLCNWYLPKKWYKDKCFRVGMGYQADSHTIDNAGQIAGYIAKYTLKNAAVTRGGVEIPKGLRRIETSHKWPKLPKISTEGYEWIFDSNREAQVHRSQSLRMSGYQIVDTVNEKSAVNTVPKDKK